MTMDMAGCRVSGGRHSLEDPSARGCLQLIVDQFDDLSDVAHLLHFLGRELKTKFLFESENEIKVLGGIPCLNGFRRGRSSNAVRRNGEEIRCDTADLLGSRRCQLLPPSILFNLIHSGQAIGCCFKSSSHKEPWPSCVCN